MMSKQPAFSFNLSNIYMQLNYSVLRWFPDLLWTSNEANVKQMLNKWNGRFL